ncbi:hypothetical protein [Actinoplanes sp. NPDC048796]|uniref:hypothetical protein n=1 Tax=Actinoplanes sp. NPDC048796 TaxID=3155640 RepID=UPI0034001610
MTPIRLTLRETVATESPTICFPDQARGASAGVVETDYLAGAPTGRTPAELISAAMREVGAFVVTHREWLAALRHVARQSQHLRAAHAGVPPVA